MNKNLKKVISAVAALSISASSIAAFAAKFPDVEETASYAQAVQELTALDVISGYDDGTFGPDKLVTRAEISKMIVDALAERQSAEASSVSSKFADVNNAGENGHWATGYINQGTADGWISGYSDVEFGPDDNVTYVQAQKMLVAAIGYDIYANTAQAGGWPSGYKLYASSLEITKGVQGVTSDDQQLTRAQVAQMIDNAMGAPICEITGYKVEWNNAKTPILTVRDGRYGEEYMTLFTEKHDAYKVYGRVTDTNKSTDGDVDVDKVNFRVEKADNFDGDKIESKYVGKEDSGMPMYIGESKADELLNVYTQALVKKDDNDDFTIISITPSAANKTVSVLAEDVDNSKTNLTGADKVLYFYPEGATRGSQKYALAETVSLYVNGNYKGEFTEDDYYDYIYDAGKEKGYGSNMVTLQKVTEVGSTIASSKYDAIMITTYATGVVEQVIDKSDKTTISFKASSEINGKSIPKMSLIKDDEDKKYTFTLNGEEIEATDLQEYDVLTISYNVEDFDESSFYEVQVSRDNTVEGRFTGMSSDKYVIGGEKYKAASNMNNFDADTFETSTDYILYLDVFGRIAYQDEIANSKKIGILKNVYSKNNGDWIAEVITKEGTIEEYTLDNGDYKDLLDDTAYNDKPIANKYINQVIEYKVSGNNKLTVKSVDKNTEEATTLVPVEAVDKEYKASTEKIGSISISDTTTIIDISNVDKKKNDFKVVSKDSLKDGKPYTAYGYNKSNSGVYNFVLLTDGESGLDSKSQLAIFVESGSGTADEDDTELDSITVLIGGDTATYFVDDSYNLNVENLTEGEPVIFSTNGSGYIDELYQVFAANAREFGKGSYESFKDLASNSDDVLDANAVAALEDIKDADVDEGDVTLKFGAVVREKKSNTGYILAPVENGVVNFNEDYTDLDVSNAQVYTYDFSKRKSDAGRLLIDEGMVYSDKIADAYDEEANTFDLGKVENGAVFAVARVINDDEVQEIYLIVAE